MLELARLFALTALLSAPSTGAFADGPAAPSPALKASNPALRVHVLPSASVVEGGRVVVAVTVEGLPNDPRLPVMLTPQVVGEAVEALRGRLFRRDARTEADGSMTFELPLLARAHGSSAVTIAVVTYDCRTTCRELTLRATVPVDVRLP